MICKSYRTGTLCVSEGITLPRFQGRFGPFRRSGRLISFHIGKLAIVFGWKAYDILTDSIITGIRFRWGWEEFWNGFRKSWE